MARTPQFKIVPDRDERDLIEREPGFHPLGVENPQTLTRDHSVVNVEGGGTP